MAKYKKRLIVLLLVQAMLTVVHVALRTPTGLDDGVFTTSWHFWIGLGFGVIVVAYALSLRCPSPTCRRMQVFRGPSVFDLSWPGEKCYFCGTRLSTEDKDGRPVEP
jgi:hypothetical protein